MIYVKENAGCNSVIKNYDSDIAILKTRTAVYITQSGTSGNWYYRKWSDKTVELWLSASLTYGIKNLIDSGILSDIRISYCDLTLPFSISTGAISTSIDWKYTEWADAQFNGANQIRIRRFGNTNTNKLDTSNTRVYIIGKLA